MQRLFIINPKSGKKLGGGLEDVVKKYYPDDKIVFTQYKGHAKELAAEAVSKNIAQVIVAGGDGTINETVQSLAKTNTSLGIIALGSGNGLARELGCSLGTLEQRVGSLKDFKIKTYDLGLANGEYFINLAGLGIEADIAAKFDALGAEGKRGKWPYFKIGAKSLFTYKAPLVKVKADGKEYELKNLSLVFANGRQYGSGFFIAPKAAFDDGLLDMTAVKKANIFKLLLGLPSFFFPSCKIVSIADTYRIKSAEVYVSGNFSYHIDGEPKNGKDKLKIEICPKAIKVLCGG